VALVIALAVGPAAAQEAAPSVQDEARADLRRFDIPAQPLADAIRQFSRQSGLRVAFDSELGKDLRSTAVGGEYTAEMALQQLLRGTRLAYRIERGVVTLERGREPEIAAVLNRIRVTAEAEGEPVSEGYTVSSSSSATKLDLSIRETPQVVHTMTRERIEDQNLTQIAEVLTQAPGTTAKLSGPVGAGRVEFYSRGFPITSVMLDGVLTTGSGYSDMDLWGALDSAIYERVELIQGSTGLTSGVGDPSATVNFIRKRPITDAQREFTLGYGRWNRLRATADVSAPLNAVGSLRGRTVAVHSEGGSWQDRVKSRSTTVYGVAEADAGESTLLTFGGLWARNRVDDANPFGLGGNEIVSYGRSYNNATQWTFANLEMFDVFAKAEHRFNEHLKSNFTYSYTNADYERTFGMIVGDPTFVGTPQEGYAYYEYARNDLTGDIHQLDISLSGSVELLGRAQKLVIGIAGYTGKLEYPIYNPLVIDSLVLYPMVPLAMRMADWNSGDVPLPRMALLEEFLQRIGLENPAYVDILTGDYANGGNRERQYAAYLGMQLKPLERLSLVLGGRYNRWERKTRTQHVLPFYLFTETDPQTGQSVWTIPMSDIPWETVEQEPIRIRKFVPYAGLVYELTSWLSAYASYTGIHRATLDPYTGAWFRDAQGKALPPLTGNSAEVGLKGAFLDDRLNVQLTGYRMRQRNWPEQVEPRVRVPGTGGGGVTNGPNWAHEASSDGRMAQGIELSAEGRLTQRWNLAASYGFTQQSLYYSGGKRELADQPQTGTLISVSEFMFPRHQAKLFTSAWLTDRFTLGGGLTWKYKTRSSSYQRNLETGGTEQVVAVPSFAVWDLMARYQFTGGAALQLNVQNLFDKAYFTDYGGTYNFTRGEYYFGPPRNAMLTFSYPF